MFAAYAYYVLFLSLSLLLFEESDTQEVTPYITRNWDEETLYDLEKTIYWDMQHKHDSVEYVKSRYKRNESFLVGHAAYNIRMKHSQQMHMIYRCDKDFNKSSLIQFTRNATSCQRMFYYIQNTLDALRIHLKNLTVADIPDETPFVIINDTLDNNTVDNNQSTTPKSGRSASDGANYDNYDDNIEYRRRHFAHKSDKPGYRVSRNVRKSMRFLAMADYTLRLEQLVKKTGRY